MNRDPKQVLTECLVLAAQGGCETSFRELHDLWRGDLRRLVLARVERAEAVDEIANDVWLTVARSLRGLDDPACFPRWIFRMVERRSADWIRRRQRDRRREAAAARESDRLAPAAGAEASDELLRLREAVGRLEPGERQLVELYYAVGRSVAEIAEVLGVPAGTVKSRLFSVRENLKQLIERTVP